MKNPAAVLDEAAQEWLDCYDAHRKFVAATKKLFCAFAAGWNGPRRGLMEAFESYRQALLASEGRFNHLEVVEVHPSCNADAD
jgi:hypothetical protein